MEEKLPDRIASAVRDIDLQLELENFGVLLDGHKALVHNLLICEQYFRDMGSKGEAVWMNYVMASLLLTMCKL